MDPPVLLTGPTISGTTFVGDTLTVNSTWSGTPVIVFAYQWFRVVTSGGIPVTSGGLLVGDHPIPGATNQTYVLTFDDVGETLFAEVTATNDFGTAGPYQSDLSGVVQATLTIEFFSDSDAFYAPLLEGGDFIILPEFLSDTDTFYTPTVLQPQVFSFPDDKTDYGNRNSRELTKDRFVMRRRR